MQISDNDLIIRTENYVKQAFIGKEGHLLIAHDFKHVNRVRNWALHIAQREGFGDLQAVEVAALLHDIGLPYVDKESERGKHGEVGAEIASRFLRENSALTEEQITQITSAIKYHGSRPSLVADLIRTLGEKGKLIEIIRDADTMDALGAVGLMRAFTSKYFLPEYNPLNIKGDAWGLSSVEFRARFGIDSSKGLAPVDTIIDQVNQQIRHYDNLHTRTARKLGEPLVQFMKDFVLQLEREVSPDV